MYISTTPHVNVVLAVLNVMVEDQMKVVHHSEPLSMSFCLDCHRKPEESLRPMDEVTNLLGIPHEKGESHDRSITCWLKIKENWASIPP